jgi:Ca2+-binding RTX toxin-like protein
MTEYNPAKFAPVIGQVQGLPGSEALDGWLSRSAQLVPSPGDTGLATSAFATATATGQNTLAVSEVESTIVLRGLLTLSFGTATATAVARDPEAGGAFGTVQTGVSAAGADLLLASTTVASGYGTDAAGAWWAETSSTSFLAIDVLGLAPKQGPLAIQAVNLQEITCPPPAPEANVALYNAALEVFGDNTLVNAQVEAITVEDVLSTTGIVATVALSEDPGADKLVFASSGADTITTGRGDDWILARAGDDKVRTGGGDNTAFGQGGNDRIQSGNGDDWLFGGGGHDTLIGGNGLNILYGGDGSDRIIGGQDGDWIRDGIGRDRVEAGGGDDTLLLGGFGTNDGNDRYVGGAGADWFVLAGASGRDVVLGFCIGEGDRVLLADVECVDDAALAELNGGGLALRRIGGDLVLVSYEEHDLSRVTFDDFFLLNLDYDATPEGLLCDEDALPILQGILADPAGEEAASRMHSFAIGDLLSLLA